MPPYIPAHREMVLASGAAELAGGVACSCPGLEQAGALGSARDAGGDLPGQRAHGGEPRPDQGPAGDSALAAVGPAAVSGRVHGPGDKGDPPSVASASWSLRRVSATSLCPGCSSFPASSIASCHPGAGAGSRLAAGLAAAVAVALRDRPRSGDPGDQGGERRPRAPRGGPEPRRPAPAANELQRPRSGTAGRSGAAALTAALPPAIEADARKRFESGELQNPPKRVECVPLDGVRRGADRC